MSFKSPETWQDPDNFWWLEEKAIDNFLGTAAQSLIPSEESAEVIIYLLHEDESYEICDKLRFYSENQFVGNIEILVHTGSGPFFGYESIYNGHYARDQWVEKTIPGGPISINKIKVIFSNDSGEEVDCYLNEIEYNYLVNCHFVYRGQDGVIDYDDIQAVMELDDTQVTIENQDLPPNTIWHFVRRQVSECGIESDDSDPCIVRIDANGDMLEDSPNPPMLLTIEKLADAKFRLRWRYTKLSEEIKPTGFHIYMDSGSGFNFSEPDTTVSCQRLPGSGEYNWTSGSLIDGQRYRFCVRSFNDDAGESQNTNFVAAIADSQGPAAITGLQVSYQEI